MIPFPSSEFESNEVERHCTFSFSRLVGGGAGARINRARKLCLRDQKAKRSRYRLENLPRKNQEREIGRGLEDLSSKEFVAAGGAKETRSAETLRGLRFIGSSSR